MLKSDIPTCNSGEVLTKGPTGTYSCVSVPSTPSCPYGVLVTNSTTGTLTCLSIDDNAILTAPGSPGVNYYGSTYLEAYSGETPYFHFNSTIAPTNYLLKNNLPAGCYIINFTPSSYYCGMFCTGKKTFTIKSDVKTKPFTVKLFPTIALNIQDPVENTYRTLYYSGMNGYNFGDVVWTDSHGYSVKSEYVTTGSSQSVAILKPFMVSPELSEGKKFCVDRTFNLFLFLGLGSSMIYYDDTTSETTTSGGMNFFSNSEKNPSKGGVYYTLKRIK